MDLNRYPVSIALADQITVIGNEMNVSASTFEKAPS